MSNLRELPGIAKDFHELIGKTPLVYLNHLNRYIPGIITAKLEYLNPSGSLKDRPAWSIINGAIKQGKIDKDTVIIEPSSGNMGVSLAAICALLNLKLIICLPDTTSQEKRKILRAYGAEVVITPSEGGMQEAVDKAKEMAENKKNSFMPSQFNNKMNPEIHSKTTAHEIWEDTQGNVAAVVVGVGTGGTLTGIGEYLKEKNPKIRIIAIEPKESAILSDQKRSRHMIHGIGAGFIPPILKTELIDEVIQVNEADAFETTRLISRKEGLMVGVSSGAAAWGAKVLAARDEFRGKLIVSIFADGGYKYLNDLWH